MNRTMRDQRMRSQVAAKRSERATLSIDDAVAEVEADGDDAARWRPFQLAFILLQLPALTDPTRRVPERPRLQRRVAVLPHRWWQD